MAAKDPNVRIITARIGGYSRWIGVNDRVVATEKARKAAWDRFERMVDPDGTLPPDVRAKRADAARKAHFTRLAYLAAKARKAKREAEAARLAARRTVLRPAHGQDRVEALGGHVSRSIAVVCTDRDAHPEYTFGRLELHDDGMVTWREGPDKRTGPHTWAAPRRPVVVPGIGGWERLVLVCPRCRKDRGRPRWETVVRWAALLRQVPKGDLAALDVSRPRLLAILGS